MKIYLINFLILSNLLLLTGGCHKTPPPPLEPPDTEIIYPSDGDTIGNASIKCEWMGINNAYEFQYHMDNNNWSKWTTDTTCSFFLDESSHTFSVKSRNNLKREDPTPASVSFNIDAIKGPALWIKSRRIHAPVLTGSSSLKVYCEDVNDLMLSYTQLFYDNSKIKIESINPDSSFLRKNGGEIQAIIEFSDSIPYASVNLGLVGGTPKGVSGSGPLFTLKFLLKVSDTSEIIITDSSEVRDSINNRIPLSGGLYPCIIIPEEQ
jgi:hypothetical protein